MDTTYDMCKYLHLKGCKPQMLKNTDLGFCWDINSVSACLILPTFTTRICQLWPIGCKDFFFLLQAAVDYN